MGIYIQADMDKLNALTPSGEAKKKEEAYNNAFLSSSLYE